MTPDAEAYFTKANESLSAAEADLAAGRHNAATSRAYYAAFQASVAILIENEIRPRGDAWEHRFVISQVSGKLIWRRKTLPAQLLGTLDALLLRRLRADYRSDSMSRNNARDSVIRAREMVSEIRRRLER